MGKPVKILSSGSIPWLGIKKAISYAVGAGYDGLEIVPTGKIVKDFEKVTKQLGHNKLKSQITNINLIKGIHQNWRLDLGLDKVYKINFFWSLFFTFIRILFFPDINKSNRFIALLSKKLDLPVTVHDISSKWTHYNHEFSGGIALEIVGVINRSPKEIKNWLTNHKHKIVVDTRDDQSLLWAKNYRFINWQSFWEWIGLNNIAGIQLTLMGTKGLRQILNHQLSTAEQQLLWLNKKSWNGVVIVEINPIMLFIMSRGRFKDGLKTIAKFVKQTLAEGKSWSS